MRRRSSTCSWERGVPGGVGDSSDARTLRLHFPASRNSTEHRVLFSGRAYLGRRVFVPESSSVASSLNAGVQQNAASLPVSAPEELKIQLPNISFGLRQH